MKISKFLKKLKIEADKKDDELRQKRSDSKEFVFEFSKVIRELENIGSEILKLSKEAIKSSINNKISESKKYLSQSLRQIKVLDEGYMKLKKDIEDKRPKMEREDFNSTLKKIDQLESDFTSAKEEYLEARILLTYLENGEIYKPRENLLKSFVSYSGALSDFCGELLRRAKLDIIGNECPEPQIKKYCKDAQKIYIMLSEYSFSNKSGVRHKTEQLKDYIKNFEDLLYDLHQKSRKSDTK